MKPILIILFCFFSFSSIFAENINEEKQYILNLKSLEKSPIFKFGQESYDTYKEYENSINEFVTNTTIPPNLRDNIYFKFKLKSKPVIRYEYNFKFSGFDFPIRFLNLENGLKFLSAFKW